MSQDYAARLRIQVDGSRSQMLCTRKGILFSIGFSKVVIGDRGPYVEFSRGQIRIKLREVNEPHYYYTERRSDPGLIKVYDQLRKVDYADYVPGMLYVSPFDLCLPDGRPAIRSKDENDKQGRLFG